MSAAKHTQGRWIVTRDPKYVGDLAIDAVIDGHAYHIALVHGANPPGDGSLEANAALIAAAPDLVNELEDAADMLCELAKECGHCNYGHGATGETSDGGVCENCAPIREAERRARAAVAKAGGLQT